MQQSLAQAQHLAIVAPSGGATCPPGSRLLDRTPLPGFAFATSREGAPSGCSPARRRACCSPWTAPGISAGGRRPRGAHLDQPVLGLCGIRLTHRQHLGPVHTSDEAARQRWLTPSRGRPPGDVRRLGRRPRLTPATGIFAHKSPAMAAMLIS